MAEIIAEYVDPARLRPKKGSKAKIVPASKSQKSLDAMERMRSNPKLTGSALLGALALGLCVYVADKGEAVDNCTSIDTALVQVGAADAPAWKNNLRAFVDWASLGTVINDSRSLNSVAADLTQSRGYYIPTERLVAVNRDAGFIQFDENGKLVQDMPVAAAESGTFCVNVPGPIYGGYDVVRTEGETLKDFTSEYLVDSATLVSLNSHLGEDIKADTELPVGTVVRTSKKIDTGFVYRQMTKEESTVNEMSGADIEMRQKIIMANLASVGTGGALRAGEEMFLPLVTSEYLQEREVTAKQIIAAFDPASVPLDVGFFEEEVLLAEARKEAEVVTAAIEVPKVTNSPAITEIVQSIETTENRKAFLEQISQAALALEREDAPVNLRVMLAQAILESSDADGPNGLSTLANEYHNLFGVKAGNAWTGQTAFLETTEFDENNKPYNIEDTFRGYASFEDSMRDYAFDFIGTKKHYQDAVQFKDDPKMYLMGLLNQLDSKGNVAIAQGEKGSLSYATDPNYATKINEIISVNKIDEIVTTIESVIAGEKEAAQQIKREAEAAKDAESAISKAELMDKYNNVSGHLKGSELQKIGEAWGGHRLNPAAAEAFRDLNAAYKEKFGENIAMTDSYRSFEGQVDVKRRKPTLAATPGKSNHGWGFALDLAGQGQQGNTKYDWLRKHGPTYGWNNPPWARPGGSGPYEPWHWEYNG